MKKITHILAVFLTGFLSISCENELLIDTPKLEITNYTVEDIDDGSGGIIKKVTFNFDENADVISFYSGEFGSQYEYREEKKSNLQKLDFSFSTNCTFGVQDPLKQFFVMASTDFNGTYDSQSIHNATWIDVTNRFTIPPITSSSTVYTPSGSANLIDLFGKNNTIYIALKYYTPNQFTNGVYTAVRVQNWQLNSETDLFGTAVLPLDFSLVEYGNIRGSGRNSIGATTITLRGNNGSFTNTADKVWLEAETEAWVISKPFTKTIDLGADKAIPIKGVSDSSMKSFSFEYQKSGEYDVVFVATNASIEGQEKIYKTMHIVIP